MIYGVDQDIEYYRCRRARPGCKGEERLTLPTEANGQESFGIAQNFAKYQVFNNDTNDQYIQQSIERGSRRAVCVVKDIRGI